VRQWRCLAPRGIRSAMVRVQTSRRCALLLAGLALVMSTAHPACAADVEEPAPMKALASLPYYNWAGGYLGGNIAFAQYHHHGCGHGGFDQRLRQPLRWQADRLQCYAALPRSAWDLSKPRIPQPSPPP